MTVTLYSVGYHNKELLSYLDFHVLCVEVCRVSNDQTTEVKRALAISAGKEERTAVDDPG